MAGKQGKVPLHIVDQIGARACPSFAIAQHDNPRRIGQVGGDPLVIAVVFAGMAAIARASVV